MTKTYNKKQIKNFIQIAVLILLLIYSVLIDIFGFSLTKDSILSENYNIIISRTLGIIFIFLIITDFKFDIFSFKNLKKSLLIIIPPLVIVVNNLPIIALFVGNAYVTKPFSYILIFIISCLGIGFFEELLFRGLIFILILKKFKNDTKGIFWAIIISSAIFGLSHLLNLLAGAGIGATILQTGYSFLMGCMWSVILLKTKNIWLCAVLHAIYDFCGMLIPQLGTGQLWDTPTVIITLILSILTAIYILILMLKLKPENVKEIYK